MRVLHLLGWQLSDIEKNLSDIASQGFDAIQISPVQPFKNEDRVEWYWVYQPFGFSIGNKYGSKEDLINLCNQAKEYNISIICDVVCNHMANLDETNSLEVHPLVDQRLRDKKEFWKEKRPVNNWDSRYEQTHYCMGLPGLNLSNHELQDIIIKFLNNLIDCGVNGFRFDAAKSIALPYENEKYNWCTVDGIIEDSCDFWPRVIYSLKKWGLIIYGEVIFSNEDLVKEYQKYLCVLSDSFHEDKDKTVVFAESHDSYLGMGYTRHKSSIDIAYDYKNRSNYYPNTQFYARPFDDTWKNNIIKEANFSNQKKLVKHY